MEGLTRRPRLVDGGVGLRVRDHLERAAQALEVLGHDRHRCHLPGREPSLRRLAAVPAGHRAVAPTVHGADGAAEGRPRLWTAWRHVICQAALFDVRLFSHIVLHHCYLIDSPLFLAILFGFFLPVCFYRCRDYRPGGGGRV